MSLCIQTHLVRKVGQVKKEFLLKKVKYVELLEATIKVEYNSYDETLKINI